MKPVILLVLLMYPFVLKALVTPNDSLSLTDPQGTYGFDWDYVVNFNQSSAVAISPYWLLTAAHVADDFGNTSITVNSITYNQVDEIYHPTADLALIKLDAPLPGYYEIHTGGYSVSRPEVLVVGYGGVGSITSTTNYTIGTTGRGTQRWGTNKIDNYVNFSSSPYLNNGFQMFFDTTDSTNEAGVGVGDSGGGVFYKKGNVWSLAGIMTNADTSSGTDSVLAVDIEQYESWIIATIPELSTWVLTAMSFGLLAGVQIFRKSERH